MPCCVQGLGAASRKYGAPHLQLQQFGDVAHNFNMLWCQALNGRKDHGFTHFAMLHSDIQIGPWWLDDLIDEMDRVDAEVMSTIIPIKDGRGLTTTGIRYPGVWGTRRYTMTEIMAMPETFSIADTDDPDQILAINTGAWTCRITTGWADTFPGFTDSYRIRHLGEIAVPDFDSEDWLFSDWLAANRVRTFVTRKPNAAHAGAFMYPNTHAWGSQHTDPNAPTRPISEALKALSSPGITIETEKPIAADSIDHLQPLGTLADNSRSAAFNRKLFELIPPEKVRLLDLGCAGGGLVRSILEAGGFAVGVEGSDISRRLGRAEWAIIPDWLFTADATEPFQLMNGSPLKFNVVCGWEFLEHIPEDKLEAVVANIRRHVDLSSNGACLLEVPNDTGTDLYATPIFIGSISSNREPHHATMQPRDWWITRLTSLGIHRSNSLEAHFGGDLVRGSNEPGAISFAFAGEIV